MIDLRLDHLADVVGGELLDESDAERIVDDVTIDSRKARRGSLFVPLRGNRVDGHDFIPDAAARGATGYLLAADHAPSGEPGAVVVDDPADALLGLGAWVRDRIDPLVVCITGSTGKTTTKDLVAAALGSRRRVVANIGSYNNELGVPLTCCALQADSEVLVAEIGARGIGHVARLAGLLRPDVSVVTTIGAAHLELFGSVDAVAVAKGELVEALEPDGVAVLNADDQRVAALAARTAGRVVTYGLSAGADWRAEDVDRDELARPTFRVRGVQVRLPMPGEHNVGNALAALAVADVAGVPLADAAAAMSGAALSRWRMEVLRTSSGITILNDAYNANPSSMEAALKTLVQVEATGRRWAVLGQMAELGADSHEAHDRIGRLCIRLGVDGLVVVGREALAIRNAADLEGFYGQGELFHVEDADAALPVLRERLRPGDVVLVKASRAVGLERVAEGL